MIRHPQGGDACYEAWFNDVLLCKSASPIRDAAKKLAEIGKDTKTRMKIVKECGRYINSVTTIGDAIAGCADAALHGIGKKNCYYCGASFYSHKMTIDHVVPKSAGGGDIKNIVYACMSCNAKKGSKPLSAFRLRLLQERISWPGFTWSQLEWLRARGFDTAELDNAKFWGEENGIGVSYCSSYRK